MDALRRWGAMVATDLRQRIRQPRFGWLLAFLMVGAWFCLPETGGGGMRVSVGEARAHYSSAWVGMALALCGSTLLSLIGFYAVRGSIARDIDSRGWELLMATPMTRVGYLLTRYLGILAVFGLFLAAMAATGLLAQTVRGEVPDWELWQLLQPLLLVMLVMLPALAMTAAAIVWFDLLPWLRGTAGNVLFFFVWVGMIGAGTAAVLESEAGRTPGFGALLLDVSGVSVMRSDVMPVLAAERPELARDSFSIGGSGVDDSSRRFHWTQWTPSEAWLSTRLALLLLATGVVLAATPLLDWAASRPRQRHDGASQPGFRLRWLDWLLTPLDRVPIGRLVAAELRLALRPCGWLWWAVALVASIVQATAPDAGRLAGWLIAMGLALPYLAHALVRDRDADTLDLLAVSPQGGAALVRARLLAAGLLGLALSAPSLLQAPLAVTAAVLSVVGVCFLLAQLTGTARAGELVYVGSAYLALNGLPIFQAHSQPAVTAQGHGVVALGSIALVLLLARRQG